MPDNGTVLNLTFSGHESFYCRQFWLKKGYDYAAANKSFSAADTVVELGVGKNMATSILYWSKSFNVLNEEQKPTDLANFLLADAGVDPYLEDVGSLWLLHYQLVTFGRASVFSLVFNQLRRQHRDWTRDQLVSFLERLCRDAGYSASPNTLQKDVDVFVRTYLRPEHGSRTIEDDFSSLLIDLELLSVTEFSKKIGERRFSINSEDRPDIPWEIILYALLDRYQGSSFTFHSMLNEVNAPGAVFALTEQGLASKIEEIVTHVQGATFTNDAGIRELQFVNRPDHQSILKKYYER